MDSNVTYPLGYSLNQRRPIYWSQSNSLRYSVCILKEGVQLSRVD